VVLSRGFGSARLNPHVTVRTHPLMEFASRSEFVADRVSPYWLDDPTSPLDLSPALWSSAVSRLRNRSHYSERRLSSGSAFLQSLTRTRLVDAAPEGVAPSTPLMSFRSLQHSPATRIHLTRACHTRYGPPPGFGYPPDGLRPSTPGWPCFVPAALLGFLTPFEAFPSRKVPETVTPRGAPACRFARRFTGSTRGRIRPVRPAAASGL
jgi:hypothetical protein